MRSTPTSATTICVSAPVIFLELKGGKDVLQLRRERAITLAGDKSQITFPPPPSTLQSQRPSAIFSITGSISIPGGVQPADRGGPPLASPPSLSWRTYDG